MNPISPLVRTDDRQNVLQKGKCTNISNLQNLVSSSLIESSFIRFSLQNKRKTKIENTKRGLGLVLSSVGQCDALLNTSLDLRHGT